ncbi:transposase [Chloroflexota bacterium]
MKHSGGRIRLSYNYQAAVVEKEGVIVATGITSEANDNRQMLTMLEKVEATVEKKPEKAVMDAGYCLKTYYSILVGVVGGWVVSGKNEHNDLTGDDR